ncbi:MAG: TonB-dependent receptor [Gemmatimonadales bacterium]
MPRWRTIARTLCALVAALAASLAPSVSQAQRPPDSTRAAKPALHRVDIARPPTLDARAEVQHRAPSTMLDLIGAQIPGVALTRAGGAVGAGGRLRIRGANSILLGTEPLIVVDGIRVDGTPADRSSAFPSHLPSRINDFEVDEIESVTVLRGPAAAAIYGSDGANGVVELVTRRPVGGPTRFAARINAGTTWLADPEGRFPSNYYLGRDNRIHEFNVLAFNRARGYPDVFSNGLPANATATVDGAVGRIAYHLSGSARRDASYLDYDWRQRYGTRLNLRYRTPSGNLTVHLNAGIRASRLRGGSVPQPILTSITFACNFPGCEPADGADSATTGWNGPRHGYQFVTPEDYDLVNARDRVTRTTGSFGVEHWFGSRFRHRLVIGPDLVRNRSSLRIEADPTGGFPFFAGHGTETLVVNDANSWSVDYLPELSWTAGGARATTTVGAHYRSRSRDYRQLFRTIDRNVTSAQEEHREVDVRSVSLHQRLRWRERLELRAGIRRDQPGYGDERGDWEVSPNLGASWNVAGGSRSQLTVNAAWGRVDRADRAFALPLGGIFGFLAPAEMPSPERVEEWEIGLAARRGDRLSATIGWYDRRIPNLLAILPRPPSGDGGGLVNQGRLTSRGLEVSVDAVPLRRDRSRLDLGLAFATNDQTLDDLALTGVLGQLGPGQFQVNGFAPGSYFFRRIVSGTVGERTTLPDGRTLPTATNLMCEGGTDLGRGSGAVVPCGGAPLLYAGRPSPAWYGSLTATFSHRGWWLMALLDGMGGHSALVGEVLGLHTFFWNSRAALEGTDPVLTGYRGDPSSSLRPGLLRAGFVKVRTLALGMTLPAAVASKLGARHGSVAVFGDNLVTLWRAQAKGFGVPWLDPETGKNGSDDVTGVSGFAQDGFPLPARLRVGVRLEY